MRKTDLFRGKEWISNVEVFRRGIIFIFAFILFAFSYSAYTGLSISEPKNLTNNEEAIGVFMTTMSTYKTMFLYVFVYPLFLFMVFRIVQLTTGIINLRKQNKQNLEMEFLEAIYIKDSVKVNQLYKALIDQNILVSKRGYDRGYPTKMKKIILTQSFYARFLECIIQENDKIISSDFKSYPIIKKRFGYKIKRTVTT